ncbi:MAG: Bug family tripartite tricarboxylate transporter substrate binding protein [Burkholderiales bacterium]
MFRFSISTALALAAGFSISNCMAAEHYPSRPVRIIVPFSPGGTSDLMARVMAQQLSEQFGQPFVVDNRAGASGLIGHGIVANAAPDGYTLATVDDSFSIVPSIKKDLPYDPVRDFTFITQVIGVPRTMAIRPSIKAASVSEFVAYARANPGKVTYASGGAGGILHLASELFNFQAKVKLEHVPYKGAGSATTGVLVGESDMVMAASPTVVPHVKSGKLRALAVTTAPGKRFSGLPDVPSLADAGVPGMVIITWFGFVGPARLPRQIANQIHSEVVKGLALPSVRDRFEGADIMGTSPEQFTKVYQEDLRRWARVVKEAGIKAD